MKYKGILFDLDGTLLDTIDDIADAVNYAMRKYSLPEWSVAEVKSFVGNGLENLMTRCIPKGYDHPQFEVIYRDFKAFYMDHSCIKTKPYDGIMELLEKLDSEGRKMAVISNKSDAAVKSLNALFFEKHIGLALGERHGVPKKPAPDAVLDAAEMIGVDTNDCVYIGDSEVDIVTAENAGLPCICVTWGFRPEELLIEKGAETIAHNIEELYQLL